MTTPTPTPSSTPKPTMQPSTATPDAPPTQPFNHFELRLIHHIEKAGSTANSPNFDTLWLSPDIWIDGQRLDEPHSIDVNAILQSFVKSNPNGWSRDWHFVFTCGCGNACCANIDEGVGSVHGDGWVDWVYRRPQANKFPAGVLGFRQWCETAQWVSFHFDSHQVIAELVRFLDEAWLLLSTTETEIGCKSELLRWFQDDPRYSMRWRGQEQATRDEFWPSK